MILELVAAIVDMEWNAILEPLNRRQTSELEVWIWEKKRKNGKLMQKQARAMETQAQPKQKKMKSRQDPNKQN